jgi:hypothetical protein
VNKLLEETFHDTEKRPTKEEYEEFVKESFATPVGRDYAERNMSRFAGARWGQEEESFTERLAKLQDW